MIIITAKIVKKLREKTNFPILECKNALIKTNGNIKKAKELLRIKLGNKFYKSKKKTKEGIIITKIKNNIGILLEINCESDFVAKNELFNKLSKKISKIIIQEKPKNLSELLNLSYKKKLIKNIIEEIKIKTGENILISKFIFINTKNKLSMYLHRKKIGSIVEYKGNNDKIAKDIAMHIVAMKPISLNEYDLPEKYLIKEKKIIKNQIKKIKKPNIIKNKIIENYIKKYFSKVTLLNQIFIKNKEKTIKKLIEENDIQIKKFKLLELGKKI